MAEGFRITAQNEAPTTLKLDGWLAGRSVLDLQAACAALEGPFIIDLANLRFADEDGISLLRRLRANGARLVGAGLFMAAALQ